MVLSKKYVVKHPFEGLPKKTDFLIVEETLPPLKENEFLCEAAYFSVDPYQRLKLGHVFPCDMIGGQVARVTESRNPEYPVGTWVIGHYGWRTHTVVTPDSGKDCGQKPFMYRLPDFGDLPVSIALGVCGRVGNTAYFGFKELCQPKPGETVVVSGAAGAVGSHVGQIAKILGCRVIGIAGTDDKCKWLTETLGFDAAGNYKTIDIAQFLQKNAPNGVDCYFDNVGGHISKEVFTQLNVFGRVAICGAISMYSEMDPEKRQGVIDYIAVLGKQIKIEGFQVNRFADRAMEGIQQNLKWVQEGKLKYQEHISVGFETTPDAFIGLFMGDNTGKALIKLS